jgi:hypothetical protein
VIRVTARKRVVRVVGYGTVLIGLIHLGVAAGGRDGWGLDALWFAGSGVAVVLIGALTVLSASPHAWHALTLTAFGANLAGMVLGIWFGAVSSWHEPQGPVLVLMFALGICATYPRLRR